MAESKRTLFNSLNDEPDDDSFVRNMAQTVIGLGVLMGLGYLLKLTGASDAVVIGGAIAGAVGFGVAAFAVSSKRVQKRQVARVAALLQKTPGGPSLESYLQYLSVEREAAAMRVRMEMAGEVSDAQYAALEGALEASVPGARLSWADVNLLQIVFPEVSGKDSTTIDGDRITFFTNAKLHACLVLLLERILPALQSALPVKRIEVADASQKELESGDEAGIDEEEDEEDEDDDSSSGEDVA